ncbi:MAG TPA: hypothetical protein VE177_06740, partial [Candidatus Binatus sp.]|nr:hypothetical protein [Candidatus Binatus sp.]
MQVTSQPENVVEGLKQYDLFLDVDFKGLTFTGRVKIDMTLPSNKDVNLDAVGLQVTSVKSGTNLNIPFTQDSSSVHIHLSKLNLRGGFQYPLEVEYKGKVSDNFTGLYKASFGEGYILSTHLEAVQARKVLPCIDHPAYKAVFKVSVRTDADLSVISNMPVESETK